MISHAANECSQEQVAHAVCIDPACECYPFLCNHLCKCLDEHNGHQLIELCDFFKVANQPVRFSLPELENWFHAVDDMISRLNRQLMEVRSCHQQWFQRYISTFVRQSETDKTLAGTDIDRIKKLTGRKMRRLFDERCVPQQVPFPYNTTPNKAQFHTAVLQPLTDECQALVRNIRKLFDSKLEVKGAKLDQGGSKNLFNDLTLDSVVMQSCRFASTVENPFGWQDIFARMGQLPYLKKLRINECGLDKRSVSVLVESLKGVFQLDLRSNNIDRHGAQSVSHMQQLRILNISYNNIGDAGALALAQGLRKVLVLNMAINNVSEETCGRIRKSIAYSIDLHL